VRLTTNEIKPNHLMSIFASARRARTENLSVLTIRDGSTGLARQYGLNAAIAEIDIK